jgi:drug/metabolite transporter (DMT)-like permease
VDTDKPNSGTELGFSFRRLALVLLVLIAFRGATGGIRELVTEGNWLAGILGVIIASAIAYWLFNLYHSEE